ncbi:MAG: DUF438 domain-containing protein [Anaerolineae bacterium]
MQQPTGGMSARKEAVKSLIKQLHSGVSTEEVTQRFQQVLHGVSAQEIAEVEDELIKEGMPREEVQRLCDVHLAVFRESLDREDALAPAGHPINILMAEHQAMLGHAQELARLAQRIVDGDTTLSIRVEQIVALIREAESHYVREENVLFPYIEQHGITQPPAIMWMEHDQIRQLKKGVYGVAEAGRGMALAAYGEQLGAAAVALAEMIASHFFKENKILFTTAMRLFTAEEWLEARREFDELGYASFSPARPPMAGAEAQPQAASAESGGMVRFATGTLPVEALEGIFNAMPVDITFVDKDDRVRFFNDIPDRVFPRAKAVIGRTVQRCHPQKSLAVVTKILEDFRAGKRDAAEFWIQAGGKFIYIRYFAVRDTQGGYLGCLEVMQDATRIRGLEGEQRLL